MSVEFPMAAAGLLIVLSLLLWKWLTVSPAPSQPSWVASRQAPLAEQALPSGLTMLEYKIVSVLGSGGCGITYLAEDTNLGRKVALKEFFPANLVARGSEHAVTLHTGDYAQAFQVGMQQFMNEARVLSAFNHPNIVHIVRFFTYHDTAYMVMRYQEGHSLGQLRRQHTQFDQHALLGLMKPLLDGLHAVHTEGFLHRDIKPSNIFVCTNNVPILLDFGAVCNLKTASGELITPMVTPGFAPIEQYSYEDRLGPWSDIYALGAVLYLLVTGKMPPEAPTRQTTSSLFRPATEVADQSRYGKTMLNAIDWALQLEPRQRPRSVIEFMRALFGKE